MIISPCLCRKRQGLTPYIIRGPNPRFIVTNLAGTPEYLYETLYCARGEAENRIKEAQLDLFGRRASCHKFQANNCGCCWLRWPMPSSSICGN